MTRCIIVEGAHGLMRVQVGDDMPELSADDTAALDELVDVVIKARVQKALAQEIPF